MVTTTALGLAIVLAVIAVRLFTANRVLGGANQDLATANRRLARENRELTRQRDDAWAARDDEAHLARTVRRACQALDPEALP